jgi:signal transduction histidine kinase
VIFKQKRFSEIQKDFINNMSHEIKTPLSVISASAETLKNSEEIIQSNRLLKYSHIILEESNRLKNQIERVLNVSLSERIVKLNTQKVDLIPLLNRLLEQFEKNTETSFIYNIVTVESKVWAHINPEYFESALYNIIENSIKYSKAELVLNITIVVTNDICISIADNGIGIDKKHLSKIFDKFYRVPTGNIHNIKGFGIGLNFVKQIIKLHKGSIRVESTLNEGSTFIINLPKINTLE